MAKKAITFENNFDLAKKAIETSPATVMKQIGTMVIADTKTKLPVSLKKIGKGRLKKSMGAWYRKKEHDLQIGFYNTEWKGKQWAAFYASAVLKDKNPLKDVVLANAAKINNLIGQAMQQIGVKDKAWVEQMINMTQDDIKVE